MPEVHDPPVTDEARPAAARPMNGRPAAGPPQGPERGLSPAVRRLAVVVIVGAAMSFLDSTIVNVALESLSRQLHTPIATIQWVVTAYLLALAAVIPVTGWLAERFGVRRVLVVAVTAFTLGSALCGLATSATMLVVFRALQGLGGGMIMPVGQILLARAAGPRNMARVMAVVGIPIVLAPVFGPTLGGVILDTVGWRWIFFVNLPVGVLGVVLALRMVPADRVTGKRPLDLIGLPFAAGGTTAITYGLSQIGDYPATDLLHVVAPTVAGFALLAGFVVRALRVEHPLLDMRLYRNRLFSAASFATFCVGVVLYGGVILMPLYYQIVRHESAVATGLLLAPGGIGAAIANRSTSWFTDRLGSGRTAVIGGVVCTLATLPFVFLTEHTAYWLLGVAMTVRGIGMGLMIMPANTAAYRILEPSKIPDATPQLSILQRVGGSIGVAVLTVVLQHHLAAARGRTVEQAHAFGTAFWWVTAVSVLTIVPMAVLALVERRTGRPAAAGG